MCFVQLFSVGLTEVVLLFRFHGTAKKNTVYHTSRTARLGALGRTGKTANAAGDPAMRQTFFFSALGLEVA